MHVEWALNEVACVVRWGVHFEINRNSEDQLTMKKIPCMLRRALDEVASVHVKIKEIVVINYLGI